MVAAIMSPEETEFHANRIFENPPSPLTKVTAVDSNSHL